MAPGLGANGGKFQISTGWHSARAHTDYFDSRPNHDFNRLWRPKERISIFDVTARYNVNRRFSVTATIPIVFNSFSTLLPPLGNGRGLRHGWHANSLGDISLFSETWLLDGKKHPFENVALGVGMKIPTGNWNAKRWMPDETGQHWARRSIYPSAIMPGDGGVGVIVGLEGFKNLRKPGPLRGTTLFAQGQYLINPRNTNGTPSMVSSLGVPITPNFANALTNSVTDSYSWSAGMATKIPGTWQNENFKGMRFRIVTGMEGIPSRDLIGGSSGWRQPGYTVTLGPGFSWARKRDFIIVDIPIVIGRHINPGRTAIPGIPTESEEYGPSASAFNPKRQMGLVAPMAISVRYVRTL